MIAHLVSNAIERLLKRRTRGLTRRQRLGHIQGPCVRNGGDHERHDQSGDRDDAPDIEQQIIHPRDGHEVGLDQAKRSDREEDPSFTADGFKPLRTRLGLAYADDCLEFGFTWRRDYASLADAKRGDSFHLYFALRNLGFRR